MSTLSAFKTNFITSADGTQIGYRSIGSGPPLVLVHGGLQSSLSFTKLAEALSTHFTVYIPDRRGRGLSGPYTDTDPLAAETDDVLALIQHTNARNIFGLSSGAILTLQAALKEVLLEKIVLYEPPLRLPPSSLQKLDGDYERALAKGKLGKAFMAITKGTGDTSFFSKLPAFIVAPVLNMIIKAQKKSEDELLLRDLIPTFHYDRLITKHGDRLLEEAKNLSADVLLMGGTKSAKFLLDTLHVLAATIPNAKLKLLEKQGHLASDNSGNPRLVANELMAFFNL